MVNRVLISMLLLSLAACAKNNSGDNDRELPVVTILTPVDGQAVTAGETIAITGLLSDNNKITEVHVHISDLLTGDLLVDIHRYPGASEYTLNESLQIQAGIQYRIQVIAKDNSANEARATVQVNSD